METTTDGVQVKSELEEFEEKSKVVGYELGGYTVLPDVTKKKKAKQGHPSHGQHANAITNNMGMTTNKVPKRTISRGCDVIKQNGEQACASSSGRRANCF